MSDCNCACNAAPKFVFSCSGAADVGEVADQAARERSRCSASPESVAGFPVS